MTSIYNIMDFKEFESEQQRFQSTGILKYGGNDRLILEIDSEISRYYRKLIPKSHRVNPQAYSAHITVIRTGIETPKNMETWGQHEGKKAIFEYENKVQTDGKYY